jgi:hypothetical protein
MSYAVALGDLDVMPPLDDDVMSYAVALGDLDVMPPLDDDVIVVIEAHDALVRELGGSTAGLGWQGGVAVPLVQQAQEVAAGGDVVTGGQHAVAATHTLADVDGGKGDKDAFHLQVFHERHVEVGHPARVLVVREQGEISRGIFVAAGGRALAPVVQARTKWTVWGEGSVKHGQWDVFAVFSVHPGKLTLSVNLSLTTQNLLPPRALETENFTFIQPLAISITAC